MNVQLKFKILENYPSQADFALAVDADESLVSRIIHGRRKLDPEKQNNWAKALGCKPRDIFTDEGKNSK